MISYDYESYCGQTGPYHNKTLSDIHGRFSQLGYEIWNGPFLALQRSNFGGKISLLSTLKKFSHSKIIYSDAGSYACGVLIKGNEVFSGILFYDD